MPNPDTGENFPLIFKWWIDADRTLPKGYEEAEFEKTICSICGVLWAIIKPFHPETDWVCPDPQCRRAKYFRETIEKFERIMNIHA